jgi:hypothetical protein
MNGLPIAEEQALADSDLPSGTNQALPLVGFVGDLAGKKDFDFPPAQVRKRGMAGSHRLRGFAFAAAMEAGGENPRIVEDQYIAGPQQAGEFAEPSICRNAARAVEMQHARGIALIDWFLRNQPFRQMKMEVGDLHG